MAEAIGLAASIVGIASAGVSVVSTLTKFGISFRGSNDKISSLAGRVSLTASILSDIATTVEQNASGFKKEDFWKTWRKVLLTCENSYGKLDKALLRARRSGASKSKNDSDGISVWGKLVWALGGEVEMQDLEASLERCCQQVMMMQQAVQMSVLSLIARRQKLSSDEIEDQRELMSKLEWLLSTLSEAGVLQTESFKGKRVIVENGDSLEPPKYSLPEVLPAKDVSRGFDPTENGSDLFSLAGDFGVKGHGISALKSLAVEAVLPQPKGKTRSPTLDKGITTRKPAGKEDKLEEEKEYFFEAYYIIPRSVPRTQPRGQIQLTKPASDDHMIIFLDHQQDYRKDSNLRNALRRAKRARDSVTTSIVNDFPRSVQDAAFSLANHRKRHANGLTWSLVHGVELNCLEESMFRKSPAKSGFLVVFRGSGYRRGMNSDLPSSPPPLSSILKKEGVKTFNVDGSGLADLKPKHHFISPPSLARVSFESSEKDQRRNDMGDVAKSVQVQEKATKSRRKNVVHAFGFSLGNTAAEAKTPAPHRTSDRKHDEIEMRVDRRNGLLLSEQPSQVSEINTLRERNGSDQIDNLGLDRNSDMKVVASSPPSDLNPEALARKSTNQPADPDQDESQYSNFLTESGNKNTELLLTPTDAGPMVIDKVPTHRGLHAYVEESAEISAHSSENDSDSEDETVIMKSPPNTSVPKNTLPDDIRPSSFSNPLKNKKSKAKVEFENAALLKSGRQVTRPVPGPVVYDPARSKLLPSSQSAAKQQQVGTSHRDDPSYFGMPSAMSSPPAPQQSLSMGSSSYSSTPAPARPSSARFASRPSLSTSAYQQAAAIPASPRPVSAGFSGGPPLSNPAYYSYSPPSSYTMTYPPPVEPSWTALTNPPARRPSIQRNSVSYDASDTAEPSRVRIETVNAGRRQSNYYVTASAVEETSDLSHKLPQAQAYQEIVTSTPSINLTAEPFRRRSAKAPGQRKESEFRNSATTKTSRARKYDEDVTIKVMGAGHITIGGAESKYNEDGEIEISDQSTVRNSRERVSELRGTRDDRTVNHFSRPNAYISGPHDTQAQPISRNASQSEQRLAPSMSGQRGTSSITPSAPNVPTPPPEASAAVSPAFVRPRKSAAIQIKRPDGEILDLESFKASPASSASRVLTPTTHIIAGSRNGRLEQREKTSSLHSQSLPPPKAVPEFPGIGGNYSSEYGTTTPSGTEGVSAFVSYASPTVSGSRPPLPKGNEDLQAQNTPSNLILHSTEPASVMSDDDRHGSGIGSKSQKEDRQQRPQADPHYPPTALASAGDSSVSADQSDLTELESGGRSEQRMAQQDEEIRRRPAASLTHRRHLSSPIIHDPKTPKELAILKRRLSEPQQVMHRVEEGLVKGKRKERIGRRQHQYRMYYIDERSAQIMITGASTAAVAGVVEHTRSKERSRSRSRQRIGTEIAGAGLAGAAVAGLWEKRKVKADREQATRRPTRQHARERIVLTPSSEGVDPELGMVQYGSEPTYTQQTTGRSRSRSRSRQDKGDRTPRSGLAIPALPTDDHGHVSARRNILNSPPVSLASPMGASEIAHEVTLSDSEPISDLSSMSGDEDSTLVEDQRDDDEGEAEELHLTQSEAQAMMMKFLATFTTV